MSSNELPPKPPDAPYDDEGWVAVVAVSDRISAMVLTLIQEELQEEGMNPQVAGVVLIVAMGRLGGRYGYRHLGSKAMWKACTDDAIEPLFRRGFRFERRGEN